MPDANTGLIGSLRRLLSTLLDIASTRLELLANELQEERLYLTQMFLVGLFALFCFGMGILLLTVFIAVLFWDDHRLVVLGALSAIFFASALWMTILLRIRAQQKSRLFSATLAELARDRGQLESGHIQDSKHE